MSTRNLRYGVSTLAAVFMAALAVRLAFCFVVIPKFHLNMGPSNPDFFTSTDGYIHLAVNWVDHGRFAFAPSAPPTTYRAPLYPLALAAAYKITRHPATAVLLVNCIASALTCVLIGAMAMYLVGPRVGFLLLLPVTLFPLSIYYCANSFSDTFCAFTYAAYFLTLILLVGSRRILTGVVCGVAYAAACLTKAVALPFPVAVLGYALLRKRSMTRGVLSSIVFGAVLVGAWSYRNWRVAHEFIPVTGGTGFNMLIGNFMIDLGRDCDSSLKHGAKQARAYIKDTTAVDIWPQDLQTAGFLDVPTPIDRIYGKAALGMFRDHPTLLLRKLAVNSLRFWYFSSSQIKSLANFVVNFGVLLLAIIGAARIAKDRRHEVELFILVAILFVESYALIIVHSSRFALPLVMTLLPFSLAAVRRASAAQSAATGTAPAPDPETPTSPAKPGDDFPQGRVF